MNPLKLLVTPPRRSSSAPEFSTPGVLTVALPPTHGLTMLIGAREIGDFTPLQRESYDLIASGPRKDVPYPFLAMLDAPGLANAIQAVGAEIRFSGTLSDEMREVAILATAGAFGSGYEWDYHAKLSRGLGMAEPLLQATRTGDTSTVGSERDACIIIALCRACVLERTVPRSLLAEAVDGFGRTGASELVAIAGYYPLLALFLSAGELDHCLGDQPPS